MNPIDNAIVLEEAKRYTDKKMQNVLGTEKINVLIDLPMDEGHAFLERKAGLVAGTTYTVALDSGNYTAVCKRIDSNGESILIIGNAALLGMPGMEDTGESFIVYEGYDSVSESYISVVVDAQAGTRCKVYETIHHIDPKFLPGVCLPVVELSTTVSSTLSELSTSESNLMDAAYNQKCPVIIKCDIEVNADLATDCYFVCAPFNIEGSRMMQASFGGKMVTFLSNEAGEWSATFSAE